MKPSLSIDLMKQNVAVRLSYILRHLSVDATSKEVAGYLGISLCSYYKVKRGESKGLSINLLISVMEALGLKYTLTIKYTGKTRHVTLEGIETSIGVQYRGIRKNSGIVLQRIQ